MPFGDIMMGDEDKTWLKSILEQHIATVKAEVKLQIHESIGEAVDRLNCQENRDQIRRNAEWIEAAKEAKKNERELRRDWRSWILLGIALLTILNTLGFFKQILK